MMYFTHIVIALTAYFGLIAIGFPLTLDLGFLAVILGSVFPDIDHPNSFISNFDITRPLSKAITSIDTHRGFMHSLLGAIIFTVIITPIVVWLNFPLVVGFFWAILCILLLTL
ncbi:MAG: hypothetical protein DRN21_00550 [Thermoplasmata archaeon]|nr:MAG: hypothetical protein DRN21_00550 [Thermoplasmata archaeon]